MDPVTIAKTAQVAATLARSRLLRRVVVAVVVAQVLLLTVLAMAPGQLVAQLAAQREQQRVASAGIDGGSCTPELAYNSGEKSALVPTLTEGQVGLAQTLWEVAHDLGMGDKAAVIGIAVAFQESQLGAAAGIDQPNADGDAGPLQQRQKPGWYGTLEQVTNPAYAAKVFYQGKTITQADVDAAKKAGSTPAGPVGYTIPGLQQVKGWEELPVTVAAQRIQRSAFPDAYAKHEKSSRGLVTLFASGERVDTPEGQAALNSGLCGGGATAANCPVTGMAMESGLTPDALRVLRCIKQHAPQITSWAGIGDRPSNVDRDHQEGRAVDAMIPEWDTPAGKRLGDQIAEWVIAKHKELGVNYVIWDAKIWSVQRADDGWRSCGTDQAGCYNGPDPTAAHKDHVHISVFGNQAGLTDGGAGTGKLITPIENYVLTARFGQCSSHWAACHTGLDFAAPSGTPIRAVTDGTVLVTKWGGAYGNLTQLQHAGDVQSWYAHQLRATVRNGETVKAGQVIGYVGLTGNTTGAHLHLEIRVNGKAVDPDQWMSAKGVKP